MPDTVHQSQSPAPAKPVFHWRPKVTIPARKSLVIIVKQEDTIGAVCSDHQLCVVAKAIIRTFKEKFGKAPLVDVGASRILIGTETNAKLYRLPDISRELVRYFDLNGAFAPTKVVLRKPSERKQWTSRGASHTKAPNKTRRVPSR